MDCQLKNAPPWIPDIGRSYGEFTEIAFSQLGTLGFSTRYMNPTRRLIVLEHIFRLRRYILIGGLGFICLIHTLYVSSSLHGCPHCRNVF